MTKIKWGILGTATIAVEAVIPAILNSDYGEVWAIASRSLSKASKIAAKFRVAKYYGDYQELLNDAEINAVYIPLPNHLHVEWAIKALRSGKHILVEKPLALNANEALRLLDEAKKHPKLRVMEAFMYKFHPQWIKAKQMVQEGAIGSLRILQASFSFFDSDKDSIVNNKDFGGGSLMDVGCYPVSVARLMFNSEPKKVSASLEYDSGLGVDIHAAGTLEFEEGRAIFFSSIQLFENQQVKLFGTAGSLEFEIPFNPLPDERVKIQWAREDLKKDIEFGPCNQYSLQTDAFSKAILNNGMLLVPLEDAIKNMTVIDALKKSDRLGEAILF